MAGTRLWAVVLQRAHGEGRERARHPDELQATVPVHDEGARQRCCARARCNAQRPAAPRQAFQSQDTTLPYP